VSTPPLPFQNTDAAIVSRRFHGRGIVGHDMGLGKTFTAFLVATKFLRAQPVVAVCPAVVKEVWRREAARHFGLRAAVAHGRTPPASPLPRRGVYVVNYDILGLPGGGTRTWTDALLELKPQLVIADESQYCKNPRARRTRAVRVLAREAEYFLALSGTPILNRPAEIWPVIDMVDPPGWPRKYRAFWDFAARFCRLHKTPWGVWDYSGASNLEELHALLLETCMVRRTRAAVLSELPKKTRTVVPVELAAAARREYNHAATDFLRWLAKKSKAKAARAARSERMSRLGYLKRLAGRLKIAAVMAWVRDFLDATDRKLLVFAVHRSRVLVPLHAKFPGSALVHGGVTGRARQAEIDRFNRDPNCRVFFGNVHAAGVGWSCTAADAVLFVELDWVPGTHLQAEDRVSGIGRGTGRPVSVYYLVSADTIEADLCGVLQEKRRNVDSVLDGRPSGDLALADLLIKMTAERAAGRRKVRVRT
jgi:SWI/SNF-related matrix-associated actin-dependent regulator of chromatin subfamily A-like protein 1